MEYFSRSDITANGKAARTQIDDITMYFQIHGEGEPILLLHGDTTYGEMVRNQILALAKHYQVIVPDLRAHGRTSDSDKPLSRSLMARDVVELLDQLGLAKAHVVGWSGGGSVGLNLAVHHRRRVRRLVGIACVFRPDGFTETFAAYGSLTFDKVAPAQVELYRSIAPDPDHLPVYLEKMKAMWFGPEGYPTRDELMGITVPTLLLIGDADEYVRQEHFAELHHLVPGSKLMVFPGEGHGVPETEPELVSAAILEFLGEA